MLVSFSVFGRKCAPWQNTMLFTQLTMYDLGIFLSKPTISLVWGTSSVVTRYSNVPRYSLLLWNIWSLNITTKSHQFSPVHTLTINFLKFCFNIIPVMSHSMKCHPLMRYSNQIYICVCYLQHKACPVITASSMQSLDNSKWS